MMNPPTESESTESNYSESFEASSSSSNETESSTSSSEPTSPVKATSRKPTPKRRVFNDNNSSSSPSSSSSSISSRASSKSEKKEAPLPPAAATEPEVVVEPEATAVTQTVAVVGDKDPSASSNSSSSSRRTSSCSTKSSEPPATKEDSDVLKSNNSPVVEAVTATSEPTADNKPEIEKIVDVPVEVEKDVTPTPPSSSSSSAASSRRSSRAASSSKSSVADPPTADGDPAVKEHSTVVDDKEKDTLIGDTPTEEPPLIVKVPSVEKDNDTKIPEATTTTPDQAAASVQSDDTHQSKAVEIVETNPTVEKDDSPPPPVEAPVPEKVPSSAASSRRASTSSSSPSSKKSSRRSSGDARSTPRVPADAKDEASIVEVKDDVPQARPSVEKPAAPTAPSTEVKSSKEESEERVDIPVARGDNVQRRPSRSDSASSKQSNDEAKQEVVELGDKTKSDEQPRDSRQSSAVKSRSRSSSSSSSARPSSSSSSRKSSEKTKSTDIAERVKPSKKKVDSRPVSCPPSSVASYSRNVVLPPVERRVDMGVESDIEVKDDTNSAVAEEEAHVEEKSPPSRGRSPNREDETNDEKIARLQRQIAEGRRVPRFPRKQKIPDPPRVGAVHSITSTSVTVNIVNGDVEGVRLYISSDDGESFHLVSCTDAPAIAVVNLAPNKPYRVLAVPVSQRFQSKRTAIVHFATSPSSSDGNTSVTGKAAAGGRPVSTNNKSKQQHASSYSHPSAAQPTGTDRSRSRTPMSRIYTPTIARGQRSQNRKSY